MHGQQNMTI